jgi:hypothetical protein
MVGVDATDRAKVMLGSLSIELIKAQVLCALDNRKSSQWNRGYNSTAAGTH